MRGVEVSLCPTLAAVFVSSLGRGEERWGPWQQALLRAWENINYYHGFPAQLRHSHWSNKHRSSLERKASRSPLNYNKLLQMSLIVVLVRTTKMFGRFWTNFLMGREHLVAGTGHINWRFVEHILFFLLTRWAELSSDHKNKLLALGKNFIVLYESCNFSAYYHLVLRR